MYQNNGTIAIDLLGEQEVDSAPNSKSKSTSEKEENKDNVAKSPIKKRRRK